MLSPDILRKALVVAYFCEHSSKRKKLDDLRKKMGESTFQKVLNLLEKLSVIEYPAEYPTISKNFPKGVPYPGTNYIAVRFIFFPSWVQSYMHQLRELKTLLKKLRVTIKIVREVREEVSKLDTKYRTQLRAQVEAINSWRAEDKKVIEHLLNPGFRGKIKFSESTRFWENANW